MNGKISGPELTEKFRKRQTLLGDFLECVSCGVWHPVGSTAPKHTPRCKFAKTQEDPPAQLLYTLLSALWLAAAFVWMVLK